MVLANGGDGYYGGWNAGNMAADQAAVTKFAMGQSEFLEAPVNDTGPGVWTAQQFRLNTAHAKILILLLAYNQPIDLLTGQQIDVDKALHYTNSKEYHHIFPSNFLSAKGVSTRRANLLANFVMLTADSNKISNRAPSEYLKEVEAALGNDLKRALESILISEAAYAVAKKDDYDTFLEERAKTIHARSKELTVW